MKLPPAPSIPSYLDESFTRNGRIQDAIQACHDHLFGNGAKPDLKTFTRRQQAFIRLMASKRLTAPALQRLYIETIDATRQLFRRPRVTDLEFDTFAALDQPELAAAYADWEYPRGARGGEANPACAKALMTMVALGTSSHVRSARMNFETQAGLQEVFAHHEEKIAALAGRAAKPCTLRDYTVCLDQIQALSSTGFARRLLKANIEILKSLRELYPKAGICEMAGIDGTDVAAWCVQVGRREQEEEAVIRRRTPKAGPRYINRDNESSADDDEGAGGHSKFWRGYYLVVLVDIKTGLPIVWTLRNGDWREADALKELLFLLYELWPDCPLKLVIGDKAWDFREYAEICLRNYGIHLVAIQKDTNRASEKVLTLDEHKNISGFRGDGTALCRHHGKQMTLVGSEFASRAGLEPGDDSDISKFRTRYRCDDCGKVYSLPTKQAWHVLTYYPHNPDGQPKRFAERAALESRRNIVESTFSSLKTVCQLALQGPRRTRLTDFDTVDTLIGLSFTVRNSLALAGERIKAGQYAVDFPAHLLGGRAMRTNA